MKAMRRRLVNQALRRASCLIKSDDGPHTTWQCPSPCGQHTADVPVTSTSRPE